MPHWIRKLGLAEKVDSIVTANVEHFIMCFIKWTRHDPENRPSEIKAYRGIAGNLVIANMYFLYMMRSHQTSMVAVLFAKHLFLRGNDELNPMKRETMRTSRASVFPLSTGGRKKDRFLRQRLLAYIAWGKCCHDQDKSWIGRKAWDLLRTDLNEKRRRYYDIARFLLGFDEIVIGNWDLIEDLGKHVRRENDRGVLERRDGRMWDKFYMHMKELRIEMQKKKNYIMRGGESVLCIQRGSRAFMQYLADICNSLRTNFELGERMKSDFGYSCQDVQNCRSHTGQSRESAIRDDRREICLAPSSATIASFTNAC